MMCSNCRALRPMMYELKPGDWFCPECGNHNFRYRATCNNTHCPTMVRKPGDWRCKRCGNHNYASRRFCNTRTCMATAPWPADVEGVRVFRRAGGPKSRAVSCTLISVVTSRRLGRHCRIWPEEQRRAACVCVHGCRFKLLLLASLCDWANSAFPCGPGRLIVGAFSLVEFLSQAASCAPRHCGRRCSIRQAWVFCVGATVALDDTASLSSAF